MRVDLNELKLWDIPIASKMYWWMHHYTKAVSIENGRIKILFRVPNQYKGGKGCNSRNGGHIKSVYSTSNTKDAILLNLGNAYYSLSQFDKALKNYNAVLELTKK